MATTVIIAKSGRRVFSKIMQRIQRGVSLTTRAAGSLSSERLAQSRRRVWVATSADPSVDIADRTSYPVEKGDFAYRQDTDEVFVCSTSVSADATGTFLQIHH